jgi:uncharacterized protein DUF4350
MSDPTRTPDRRSGARDRRRSVIAIVAVVIVSAFVLVGALRGPRSAGGSTDGTRALRRFLAELGVQATDGHHPPSSGGTFVLSADFRSASQDSAILDWVREGGRLVVMDPRSGLAGRLGAAPQAAIGGLPESSSIEAGCDAPEVRAAGIIEVASTDVSLAADSAALRSCFQRAGGAFQLAETLGTGTVYVLGGSSPFTDALLDKADNAAYAAQLFATSEPVVFGSATLPGLPTTGGGSQKGVWGSLPDAAKAVLLGLALALVAFALVRARRLGRPVLEDPLAPIPAGELVVATGRLYRRARSLDFAAELLRTATVAQLARRLGLPPGASPEELASAMAATTSVPEEQVRHALAGPVPRSDDDLIALGRELEDIKRAIGSPSPTSGSPPPRDHRTLMEAHR